MFGLNLQMLAVAGALLAFGGLAASCNHYKSKAETFELKLDLARAELDAAMGANASNEATIAEQRNAIEQWKALVATESARSTELAAQARDYRELIASHAEKLTREEAIDHARPECERLLQTDLAAVCPGIAVGLRERAARRYQDGH